MTLNRQPNISKKRFRVTTDMFTFEKVFFRYLVLYCEFSEKTIHSTIPTCPNKTTCCKRFEAKINRCICVLATTHLRKWQIENRFGLKVKLGCSLLVCAKCRISQKCKKIAIRMFLKGHPVLSENAILTTHVFSKYAKPALSQ